MQFGFHIIYHMHLHYKYTRALCSPTMQIFNPQVDQRHWPWLLLFFLL